MDPAWYQTAIDFLGAVYDFFKTKPELFVVAISGPVLGLTMSLVRRIKRG